MTHSFGKWHGRSLTAKIDPGLCSQSDTHPAFRQTRSTLQVAFTSVHFQFKVIGGLSHTHPAFHPTHVHCSRSPSVQFKVKFNQFKVTDIRRSAKDVHRSRSVTFTSVHFQFKVIGGLSHRHPAFRQTRSPLQVTFTSVHFQFKTTGGFLDSFGA